MPMTKWRHQPSAGPIAKWAVVSPSEVLSTCPMAIFGRPIDGSTSSNAVMAAVPTSPAMAARATFMVPPCLAASGLGQSVAYRVHVGRDQEHLRLLDAPGVRHHERARQTIVHPVDDRRVTAVDVPPRLTGQCRRDGTALQLVTVTAGAGALAVKDLPTRVDHRSGEHRAVRHGAMRGVGGLRVRLTHAEGHH